MTPPLHVEALTKSYRAGVIGCSARVAALRGVTLQVGEGELLGLLGPNGAGKSTLLLCAAGLLRPDSGTVRWFGEAPPHGIRPAGIAYVPEKSVWYDFLTVRESLHYFATLHDLPVPRQRADIDRLLEQVALAPHAEKRINHLSRGMLQRLGLAQALLGKPRLLLLDETLSGLDPVVRRDIRDLLRSLRDRGVSVVLSTHDLDALEEIASRIVLLAQGRIVATVDPRALTGRAALELTVPSPDWALRQLRAWVPDATEQRGRVRVPLTGATPEEVLAQCRARGVVVTDSRVIVDDLEQRFFDILDRPARVAEGPAR